MVRGGGGIFAGGNVTWEVMYHCTYVTLGKRERERERRTGEEEGSEVGNSLCAGAWLDCGSQ